MTTTILDRDAAGRKPRSNQPHRTSVVEDLDAKRFWELPGHSVRCLQLGDMIARSGQLITVVDVQRFKTTGQKRVDFDDGFSMLVSDEKYDDVDVTIYRPRAGF